MIYYDGMIIKILIIEQVFFMRLTQLLIEGSESTNLFLIIWMGGQQIKISY